MASRLKKAVVGAAILAALALGGGERAKKRVEPAVEREPATQVEERPPAQRGPPLSPRGGLYFGRGCPPEDEGQWAAHSGFGNLHLAGTRGGKARFAYSLSDRCGKTELKQFFWKPGETVRFEQGRTSLALTLARLSGKGAVFVQRHAVVGPEKKGAFTVPVGGKVNTADAVGGETSVEKKWIRVLLGSTPLLPKKWGKAVQAELGESHKQWASGMRLLGEQ
ncbi:MAG: hypothetical protein AB1626_04390 [Candidatus Micrarchaeota archaeon]